jgi:exonuclease VII large subunit
MNAYDVDRQLERGYTLTFDEHGHLLRSASATPIGSHVVTRFADGTVRSRVESSDVRTEVVENEEK